MSTRLSPGSLSLSSLFVSALLTLTVLAARPAHAQALLGPEGKPSYFEVHGEMLRSFDGVDAPVGGSLEFGSFQNKYIAMGTVLGLESPGRGTGLPMTLYLGAGISVHIPIVQHFLIIPEVSLGYSIQDSSLGVGGGLAAYMQLGAAYRIRRFYFGLEAQRPIYLALPGLNSAFFPNYMTAGLFGGLYF